MTRGDCFELEQPHTHSHTHSHTHAKTHTQRHTRKDTHAKTHTRRAGNSAAFRSESGPNVLCESGVWVPDLRDAVDGPDSVAGRAVRDQNHRRRERRRNAGRPKKKRKKWRKKWEKRKKKLEGGQRELFSQ
eukprot:2608479-Rhodomonas_salina.1